MAQGDMAYTGRGTQPCRSGEKNDGDGDWRRRRRLVVYLAAADKYPRPTRRQSRGKKAWTRGLSWHPSRLLTPGDALEVSRVDAPRQLRPPPWLLPPPRLAYTPTGWGHGGTRNRSTSRRHRHGRSAPLPWRACRAAPAWPSRSRWWARAGAGRGIRSRGANRN